MHVWLFILGLAIGSFINVVALRYNPEKFIFSQKVIGGRSACPKCGKKLNWFELLPLFSFVFLLGRCRSCKGKISWQYPVVEFVSGLIFVLVPAFLKNYAFKLFALNPENFSYHLILYACFVIVFLLLLLVSIIDIRLRLIPDEVNIFLIILGIILVFLQKTHFSLVYGSFLGSYSALFGLRGNIWVNHLAALIFGAVFFGILIFITRGRGMGMGDLKLAAALGAVFGWPDILLIVSLSFILGSVFSLPSLIFRKKGLKSLLPFGPFLALASLIIFFFGQEIMSWYFSFLHL